MALKDWKKVGEGEWKHKKKDRLFVRVDNYDFFTPNSKGKFRGLVYSGVKQSALISHTFKSKSQALKFAKSYMRTH